MWSALLQHSAVTLPETFLHPNVIHILQTIRGQKADISPNVIALQLFVFTQERFFLKLPLHEGLFSLIVIKL
jgi:hypothetical protein